MTLSPRHLRLPAHLFTVSGHQPILFGTAGYWSKMMATDLHLVVAGVKVGHDEGSGRLMLPSHVPVTVPLRRDGRRSADLVMPRRPDKVLRALELSYGRKAYPFRHRIEPILEVFDQPGEVDYLALWLRVHHATCRAAGLTPPTLLIDSAEDDGPTTQARQQMRLARLAPGCDLYVAGPGARAYLTGPTWRPVLVHQMESPSPLPFLHAIVTEPEPAAALRRFSLEPL